MLAFNIGQTLLRLWNDSGVNAFFVDDGWKSLVMIAIACVFLYLGIVKKFEPLLLVGIAFGCLLSNLACTIRSYGPTLWTRAANFTTAMAMCWPTAACWTFSTSVSKPVCIPA